MGVQAIRTLVGQKSSAVISAVATASVAFPAAGSVKVIAILAAGDLHRKVEIYSAIMDCINHLRDANLNDDGAADLFVARKLNESKSAVRSSGTANLFVTGDVGIALDVTQLQNQSISIDAALIQVLDWMREQDRLAIPPVWATGILTAAAQVTADDTVTINGRVYTFVAAPAVADDIDIGAAATDTLDNLIAAINGAAGEGTKYGTGTIVNNDVTALAGAGDTIDFTAISQWPKVGNAVTTVESAAQLSWGAGTLTGGT